MIVYHAGFLDAPGISFLCFLEIVAEKREFFSRCVSRSPSKLEGVDAKRTGACVFSCFGYAVGLADG